MADAARTTFLGALACSDPRGAGAAVAMEDDGEFGVRARVGGPERVRSVLWQAERQRTRRRWLHKREG